MSIEQVVNQVVKQAKDAARVLAEAHAKQSERIRRIPAQTEQLLAMAAHAGARDRLLPVLGITIAALDEHRRTLSDVIEQLEKLAGAAS